MTVVSKTGPPQQKLFKGSVAQFCGDNLGMNQLFNYVAAFSRGTYFCRFCEINSAEIEHHFEELPGMRRTVESHAALVALKAARPRKNNIHGVKGDCFLHNIPFFHVTENYTVSIMHDFWHGFAKVIALAVCDDLIRKRIVTLDGLNSIIKHFDYGFEEAKNRPNVFKRDSDGKLAIKVTFTECACLVRLLPQMLGDRVNAEEVKSWEVLLKLLDVASIVFAPVVSTAMVDELRDHISDFLAVLSTELPDVTITPKLHFLTHYPAMILELGPLFQFSEMRFEARHNPIKQQASNCCNFKNITKTLAWRNQLTQASEWFDGPPWGKGVSKLSKSRPVTVRLCQDSMLLSRVINPDSLISTGETVVFRGVAYRRGSVLVCGVENNFPKLGQILRVYAPRCIGCGVCLPKACCHVVRPPSLCL